MRMKKRVLALILTLSMVFTMLNTAFAASPSDFSDLPADWSRGAVERAIENGLLSGANGKINLTAQLTRAELAAIVVRAFGTSQTADLSGFSDVSQSEWYYDALQKAVAMGILSGNNGRLNPNAPITREEVCVVLYRAFLLQDGGSAAQRFGDAGQISDWAQAAVAAMAAKGCLTGDSQGNVNASKTITRAEFAQMTGQQHLLFYQEIDAHAIIIVGGGKNGYQKTARKREGCNGSKTLMGKFAA